MDRPSTDQVQYGRSRHYGARTPPKRSHHHATRHVRTLTGLEPGTRYHFRIRSTARAGKEAVSADHTFRTNGVAVASTPGPTADPTPTAGPTPTPEPKPTPTPDSPYAAVFAGDATGASDVTAALRSFLQSHNGQTVALARNATYTVTQLSFTAHDLTVDFRGARLQGSSTGVHGILRVQSSSQVVLNDPSVSGTGYVWDGVSQAEAGIQIDGGSDITLNRPVTRDTRGDGIYVGYQSAKDLPTRILISNPNIERASRNGIAPVAGEVTIRGGHIDRTGLHGVDFEANDATGAASIRGVVDGVDIRRPGDLAAASESCTCYAVAAGGSSSTSKPSIRVENVIGDRLRMTIRDTDTVVVRNNTSDTDTTADFPGSGSVTFSGNTRIARQ